MDDDLPEGETVEFDAGEDDVQDTEDGGAIVKIDDEPKPGDSDFYDNLAETMSDSGMNKVSTNLVELIERDKDARSKRDKQYEEGIRRTGLGDDAPGGASFQGASKVVHPLLTEVCVDFSARAIKEIFPADGPAKMMIPGTATQERADKGRRKALFMNWQLTTQSKGFRGELEQLLTQLPLGGAQYLKLRWDEKRNRPDFLFIPIDDVYLPFAATNFYTAQRKTHVQYITQLEFEQRVKSGMYRDVDLVMPGMAPEGSKASQANDKIEGRTETAYNEDGLRTVFEIYVTMELDEDDEAEGAAPYIISIDKTTNTVLSIYRNWDEEDDTQEELEWIIEFPFVPWRGAYPIGIIHMIGGIAAASTGALRALLDSAHISNSQTMLKLKGGSRGGQSLDIQPTEIMEIEGGLNVDDIRKLAMPLPFNQPSAVLMQLLGFLVDAGKGVVQTTLEDAAANNPNAPVGTTLANMEQGMVVFSAIHSRLHNAMARVLCVLHRLNAMYLDDRMEIEELGENVASRRDFSGPMDVVPVSDPNIFSEAQRFAQVQAVAQRASLLPQLYNARKVEERILQTLKIPSPMDLLNPPVDPVELNAVAENVAATMGKPILAFPEQDHIAHLKAHLSYMMSPALGMSKLIAPALIPVMLNHIKEHIAMWYAAQVYDLSGDATGEDLGEMLYDVKTPDQRKALDGMLAEASTTIAQQAPSVFEALPAVIDKAIQMMQSLQPQPPVDPSVAVAQAETARRAAADQAKEQVDQARIGMDQQIHSESTQVRVAQLAADQEKARGNLAVAQAKLQLASSKDDMHEQHEDARTTQDNQTKVEVNAADNRTAIEIAEMEIDAGKHARVTDGTGLSSKPKV